MANESNRRGSELARRYAGALIGAGERAAILAAIDTDLDAFDQLLSENPSVRRALTDPGIASTQLRRAIAEIGKKSGWQDLTRSFFDLVIAKRRQTELASILAAYRQERRHRAGLHSVDIIFARQPSEEAQSLARNFAQKTFGERAELAFSVDPALIGGIMMRSGSQLLDGSVRGKLASLRSLFKETL